MQTKPTQYLTIINLIFETFNGKLARKVTSHRARAQLIERIYREARDTESAALPVTLVFTTYEDGKYDNENKAIIGDTGAQFTLSGITRKKYSGSLYLSFELYNPDSQSRKVYKIRKLVGSSFWYGTYIEYNGQSTQEVASGIVKCSVAETTMNLYRTPNFDALQDHKGPIVGIPENGESFKQWQEGQKNKKTAGPVKTIPKKKK